MKFKSKEEITNKIGELHSNGFDRIHLPGGTSIDGNFYSGVVVADYDEETKEIYFLGVPYCSSFHFKGEGGHNKKTGETPETAAVRELLEETGIQIKKDSLDLVFEKDILDNRSGRVGKFHTKYFYLVTKFTGNLFTFEGENPMDGETAAPIWIPASLFVKVVFGGHLTAVNSAIKNLCMQDRKYAYALMNLL
ncbi:MAG: NUDIX hydrolase [Candidatus Pacebacteria bacterium]|nr:NUDIX hydrolase [Candidatus Paceibacterota bacterium]